MSKSKTIRSLLAMVVVVPAILGISWNAANVAGGEPGNEAARCQTYTAPDGATYFALSLPATAAPAAAAHDLVILFDTSATQAGQFREKGLEMLGTLLETAGDHDRVRLLAVDLNAISLTHGFVPAHGAAIDAALNKLRARTPLGATDMGIGLAKAVECFDEKGTAARSIIYIGDGSSKANAALPEFNTIVDKMVADHISVTSCAIGGTIDATMLAALANQTGGMLMVDSSQLGGKESGQILLRLAEGAVIWPTTTTLPKSIVDVLPKRTPPLRADRDTILLGKLTNPAPFDIKVAAESSGKPVSLAWNVAPGKSDNENSYIAQLVAAGSADGGYRLPTIGSEGLAESRRMVHSGAQSLARLSSQAAASGNRQQAQQLVDEALRRDPNNQEAVTIKTQLGASHVVMPMADDPPSKPAGKAGANGGGEAGDLNLQGSAPIPPAPDANQGQMLDDFERLRQLRIQQFTADVNQALESARSQMSTNPASVVDELNRWLAAVDGNPDLSADQRAQLRDHLISVLRPARDRRETVEKENLLADRSAANAKEKMRIEAGMLRDQEKVKQLIERMNALLAERRYQEAMDDAVAEVVKTAPDWTIATQATVNTRFVSYNALNDVLRQDMERQFLATMHLVDTSAIPFPDDPPIVYPSADTWRQLTKDRQKYRESADLKQTGSAEEKILKALGQPTEMDFDQTSLKEVIDAIKIRHGIEIQLDEKALNEASIPLETPITINLKGITLRSALRLMLGSHDLNYYIDHEVLLITTDAKQKEHLVTKVYPVADLVLPVAPPFALNPFQMGGGAGGSNSMNGGMGGGAFGGGGMQGGGFGGGGGGFGGGGGGALDVPDPEGAPAPQPKTEVKAKRTAKIAPVAADPNAEATWNEYFAKLAVPAGIDDKDAKVRAAAVAKLSKQNADVRKTVLHLMNEYKFADASALLRGALRNGWGQPWMYEALTLAMQASDQPKEEIERVLMSAVAFARTNDDLMYVAAYLSRSGFDARALKLYQQVAASEPFRLEPYMHGLEVANQLKDVAGIQWACVGVLSQTWPSNKTEIVDLARRTALAKIEELRKQGKSAEADRFQTALTEAQQRDCLVRLTLNGDAEIDVAVNEPPGSVCSLRTPRTMAGGVLLDGSALRTDPTAEGTTIEYVVNQGFSGKYEMLMRRVWGKVAGGKVTVDIYTHVGTKQATRIHKQIPLGEKDALVVFDLKEGRRQESLVQAQVANAAEGVVGVNQAILAQMVAAQVNPAANAVANANAAAQQNLAAINDPNAAAALIASRLSLPGNNGQGQGQGGFIPFVFPQGAVGYQPVITVLPEGTNMMATAVISADRRYVRIAALPFFSAIGDVQTFNYTTGQTATTSQGSGFPGQGGAVGGAGGGGGAVGGGLPGGGAVGT